MITHHVKWLHSPSSAAIASSGRLAMTRQTTTYANRAVNTGNIKHMCVHTYIHVNAGICISDKGYSITRLRIKCHTYLSGSRIFRLSKMCALFSRPDATLKATAQFYQHITSLCKSYAGHVVVRARIGATNASRIIGRCNGLQVWENVTAGSCNSISAAMQDRIASTSPCWRKWEIFMRYSMWEKKTR